MNNVWLKFLLPVDDSSVSQPSIPAPGLTIGRALVLLVAYLVTNNLVTFLVLVFLPRSEAGDFTAAHYAFAGLCGFTASLALIIRMANRVIGPALLETGETEAAWVLGPKGYLLLGLVGGIACAALSLGWQSLIPPGPDAAGVLFIHRLITTPGWTVVFFWPVLVVIGPALEELLFRGILLGALSQKTGTAIATTIVTLLFVATHFQVLVSYLPAVAPLAFLGIVLALLRFRARAVGPAIVLHATYNAILGIVALLTT